MAKGSGNECFEGLDSVSIPASFSPTFKGCLYNQGNEGMVINKVRNSYMVP